MLIAKGNILLWDDYFVDERKTNAEKILHHPVKREKVMSMDERWEGDGCGYFNIVDCHGFYRMYYNACGAYAKTGDNDSIRIAAMESEDGIRWKRIERENDYLGTRSKNNIVFCTRDFSVDNFVVFYDENFDCPADEKFKALAMICDYGVSVELCCFVSADGLDFKKKGSIFGKIFYTEEQYRNDVLMFDTMNICFWDSEAGKYRMFVRGFHNIPTTELPSGNDRDRNEGVRDVRYSESADFEHWTNPVRLKYDTEEYAIYTNQIIKYFNSKNMYVGFPTRYVERKKWSDSFEELCGKEYRKERMQDHPRFGLAVTDTLFMYSRDCINWTKYDEAFITPGEEHEHAWVYGSCYLAYNMIRTKREGKDDELSLFMPENRETKVPVDLYRYSIRIDGFISRYGDYRTKKIVSKPFILDGDSITVNFSTSAAGSIKIRITDEDGKVACSDEHFGDKVDRKIKFDKPLLKFKGRTCIMEIELKDAHLFSISFL